MAIGSRLSLAEKKPGFVLVDIVEVQDKFGFFIFTTEDFPSAEHSVDLRQTRITVFTIRKHQLRAEQTKQGGAGGTVDKAY